jgi:dolichol-phosphate mannosyltransferase
MISVVVPLFNEDGNVDAFVERAEAVLAECRDEYELVLVDDGSSDATWQRIVAACGRRPALRGVRLSRNFGHQGALLAGLSCARGDAVITMDGDLQHPPELLPAMIDAWRSGAKIVLTQRVDGRVTPALKRLSSRLFYRVFSSLADTRIEPGSSDFRLLDRQVLVQLLSLRFGVPFLRGAVQLLGFPTNTLQFEVEGRGSGASKYTPRRMLALARQGLISHSTVPLRLGIWLGAVTFALSIAELVYVLVVHATGRTVPGWASTVGITSLFSAWFLLIGVMGLASRTSTGCSSSSRTHRAETVMSRSETPEARRAGRRPGHERAVSARVPVARAPIIAWLNRRCSDGSCGRPVAGWCRSWRWPRGF